jgi:parallel beta-helix repeat protein
VVRRSCIVSNSSATENSSSGFTIGAGGFISHCLAKSNGFDGIAMDNACSAMNCITSSNGANGIRTAIGCSVVDCFAQGNDDSGIQCSNTCLIRGNTCSDNGSVAGIFAVNTGNRIEGNNCSSAAVGIRVNGSDNIIIKNTCRGNTTNWIFVAGNAYGPIVNAPSGAAVSGSTASAALGSTDPNANFSY